MKCNQLTKDQINAIIRQYQSTHDKYLLSPLLVHLRPFLLTIARRYGDEGATWVEDMVQECTFMILDLVESYDTTSDESFEDYISTEIRHLMASFLREYGCTVSRPPRTRTAVFIDSIDKYLDDVEEDQPDLDPDERFNALYKAIDTLSPMEREVIDRSFDCDPDEDQLIAEDLHISRSRLRQLRNQILRKLHVRINELIK